ncbi:MAG: YetF domain-containing protein [Pseudolabrys sp.]
MSYLVKGTETTVIRDGKVDRKALAASHMSDDDLAEDLRQQGVEMATEVKSARLERSGKLSVIKK